MTKIAFLDLETTGLDPFRNEILEVGMIVREDGVDKEVEFSLNIEVSRADVKALQINRYYHRTQALAQSRISDTSAAARLQVYLENAVVVGNNVQFDLRFIEHFLRNFYGDTSTPWHYHPVDLKALVAGRFGLGEPPWSTKQVADAVGVKLPLSTDRHTAMSDVRWNRDVYDALYEGESA